MSATQSFQGHQSQQYANNAYPFNPHHPYSVGPPQLHFVPGYTPSTHPVPDPSYEQLITPLTPTVFQPMFIPHDSMNAHHQHQLAPVLHQFSPYGNPQTARPNHYSQQPIPGPSTGFPGFQPLPVHNTGPASFHFVNGVQPVVQLADGDPFNQIDWDAEGERGNSKDMLYGSLEVKHRRRTTPEQLKVLEVWFEQNAKPDNALREHLAQQLGMTKRNVQVWFQNRRAKMKGLTIKRTGPGANGSDDEAENNDKTTPEKRRPAPLVLQRVDQVTPPGRSTNRSFPPPPQLQLPDSSVQSGMAKRASSAMPPPPHPRTALPVSSGNQQNLLTPATNVNIGRRVSLAHGEAANIDAWAAKHMTPGGFVSEVRVGVSPNRFAPVRSPSVLQGSAGAARRSSGPYSAAVLALGIITSGQPLSPQSATSPKISPGVRAMPSTLHLTAMRNNSRRASMPGVAQARLISSGPFVPPRVASTFHQVSMANTMSRPMRELSPIKDHDNEAVPAQPSYAFGETDFSTTYLTPLSSTYLTDTIAPTSYFPVPFDMSGQAADMFAPNAPLPNPDFSFGSSANGWQLSPTDEEVAQSQAILQALQDRNRVDSITSVNSFSTEGAHTAGDGSDFGAPDWAQISAAHGLGQDGLASDARRASAPADLLHHLGILGIGATPARRPSTFRPSPLGSFHHDPASFDFLHSQHPLATSLSGPNPLEPLKTQYSDPSSTSSSERPSPTSASSILGSTSMSSLLSVPMHAHRSQSAHASSGNDDSVSPWSATSVSYQSQHMTGDFTGMGFTMPSEGLDKEDEEALAVFQQYDNSAVGIQDLGRVGPGSQAGRA